MEFGILPFYLAIRATLFGTYGIVHRIGGLFVVYGGWIRVCGYLGVLYYVSRNYLSTWYASSLGVWSCLPERKSLMIVRYDPDFDTKILSEYM